MLERLQELGPIWDDIPTERTIDGLTFALTCRACPEQYDVYRSELKCGYVRVRWGAMRVDVPERDGWSTVLSEPVGGPMTGDLDGQREEMLGKAATAINKWLAQEVTPAV